MYMFIIYVLKMFLFVVSNSICLFTLSVVDNLVVLVYRVDSVFYLNLNSTPILKFFSILHSNGR